MYTLVIFLSNYQSFLLNTLYSLKDVMTSESVQLKPKTTNTTTNQMCDAQSAPSKEMVVEADVAKTKEERVQTSVSLDKEMSDKSMQDKLVGVEEDNEEVTKEDPELASSPDVAIKKIESLDKDKLDSSTLLTRTAAIEEKGGFIVIEDQINSIKETANEMKSIAKVFEETEEMHSRPTSTSSSSSVTLIWKKEISSDETIEASSDFEFIHEEDQLSTTSSSLSSSIDVSGPVMTEIEVHSEDVEKNLELVYDEKHEYDDDEDSFVMVETLNIEEIHEKQDDQVLDHQTITPDLITNIDTLDTQKTPVFDQSLTCDITHVSQTIQVYMFCAEVPEYF